MDIVAEKSNNTSKTNNGSEILSVLKDFRSFSNEVEKSRDQELDEFLQNTYIDIDELDFCGVELNARNFQTLQSLSRGPSQISLLFALSFTKQGWQHTKEEDQMETVHQCLWLWIVGYYKNDNIFFGMNCKDDNET